MFWDNVAWIYDLFANGINRRANRTLCAAVERLGKHVWLAAGDECNIKITTPMDLAVAEAILHQREAAQ